MTDEQGSKESEAKRLERFKAITLEDVKCAREHLVAAPGDIVEIPVEYYDWLIGKVATLREERDAARAFGCKGCGLWESVEELCAGCSDNPEVITAPDDSNGGDKNAGT